MTELLLSGKRGFTLFPGWDYSNDEERTKHGQHSPEAAFFVRGTRGCIVCRINLGWPPHIRASGTHELCHPYWCVEIHKELDEVSVHEAEDYSLCDHCLYLEQRACVSTTTYLPDLDHRQFLLAGGDYLYPQLEASYARIFGEPI